MGGRGALSPISVISDIGLSLKSELRCRTERAESDIISYIGINIYTISDIRHPNLNRQAHQLSVIALANHFKGGRFESTGCNIFFFNVGYRNELWCRSQNTSDIVTFPISEWRFSVWHICLRHRNNGCWCRMSDIANIKNDVDAHLWCFQTWKQ